jgi:hypothetical protein
MNDAMITAGDLVRMGMGVPPELTITRRVGGNQIRIQYNGPNRWQIFKWDPEGYLGGINADDERIDDEIEEWNAYASCAPSPSA